MPQLFPMNWIMISSTMLIILIMTMVLIFFFKINNTLNLKKNFFKINTKNTMFKW
uniref:ATP synthase subunit 8 n=1 Tax=Haemaphysalis inermis TaxID=48827 RepID=L7PCN0_9ACAR|nr:ATP synthase F0 subunit 8 [Haemaphysalis inermis]AFU55293.1 ATP synthase subunit 8 [Haemaphysalis inermis]